MRSWSVRARRPSFTPTRHGCSVTVPCGSAVSRLQDLPVPELDICAQANCTPRKVYSRNRKKKKNSGGVALLSLLSMPFSPMQIKRHPGSRASSQGCLLTQVFKCRWDSVEQTSFCHGKLSHLQAWTLPGVSGRSCVCSRDRAGKSKAMGQRWRCGAKAENELKCDNGLTSL